MFCSVFASSSSGRISSASLTEAGQLVGVRSWRAHEHEAWIVAADHWDSNVVYSGIENSMLHVIDNVLSLLNSRLVEVYI